jgi:hypothetical protein
MRRALLLAARALPACQPGTTTPKAGGEDVKKDARDTADKAGQLAKEKKDEFVKATQVELDRMDRQLDEWKAKAKSASGEAKEKLDKKIAELEPARQRARQKVDELKADSRQAWEDELKPGVEKATGEMKAAWEKAKDVFK